jgi:DNA-binding response OmpR family regulator
VLRVLVVDDKLELAEVIAEGLSDRGYVASAVRSAKAALALLRTERVDALVTDVRMPEMDGLELLAASRRLDPSRPVILMTAFGSIEAAMTAFDVGADRYLMKPFRLDALTRILEEALTG